MPFYDGLGDEQSKPGAPDRGLAGSLQALDNISLVARGGEVTAVDVMQMAAVTLPEIVVTGQRIDSGSRQVATRQAELLPALAAAAGKALAEDETDNAQAPSVLLK